MIGGYQILDLKGVNLKDTGSVEVKGISAFLNKYYDNYEEFADKLPKKPILLTNFYRNQIYNNSIFTSFEKAGAVYTAYIYGKKLEIVNDKLTLKPIA